MGKTDSESFQIHNTQTFHDLPGTCFLIKIEIRTLGLGDISQDTIQFILEKIAPLPMGNLRREAFRQKDFPGGKGTENGKKVLQTGALGERKFSRGKIEPGAKGCFLIQIKGYEKVVTGSIQLLVLQQGARG